MPIRSLLIWGVIALLLVVLFAALQGPNANRNAQELPYSGLLASVEQGEVQSATTQGDTIYSRTKTGEEHVTYLPSGTMPILVERLVQADVQVKTERPRSGPSIGDILLGVLPMLLLIGAWFFFMRQMQGGGRGGAMGFGRSKAQACSRKPKAASRSMMSPALMKPRKSSAKSSSS